ncbi:bifunctional 3-(3-hydroxy-phenyl)propionate/3-hydroxycinnamic acid hydroxylase [Streptomyces ipomoeae]|uniref:3-(3-hydroxyphenyl)propionate hydroxylase n=1 Tax=Streptomyces ipomoeae 91-03 TaxID=698759 RepID=L1KIH3_9ACTN|nr:bifunctional 3-(3-hydroxy-phenyl)propionate/3-hydroxycinnamic acid hydroxylase [Streptomyces ipomoeae]EKX60372.1 3-(3-hydroxyphenyl)propionate hydroxylase [Streptomyces ipomoeae 91-03]MDX2693228.1 bifunctional 3-(3-hydroxy-phenyl)propionate/3-hydroxycinnamic acid hydroxylase [Streptomyces ipomoeae]MDX2822691.1 bifunctional 3-(3-hydroxy-phenyl)propionate/3-hydroxycinnamic acid hydroxylase [Streptomyces ipomoeae]MDX2838879.1 bifunctional 3-(3-hydroxy-phenyl)propionate/3-hydroxycinnamic acid hy
MSTPTELRTQVAVVGAGPVGATVANYLGLYGVETLLIDRTTDVVDYPRAVGMDDECLRSFQGIGLADDMLADMLQNIPLKMFGANGRCFADIRPATKEFGWPRRNIFMQQLAERTLRKGLERHPHVRPLYGHELVRLEQDGTEVRLHLTGPDDERVLVHADYVVAADGGRSTIRTQLNIPLIGDTHPRKWVVIECDNDPLDAPYTGLHCDPTRPYVCLDLPYNYRRWEFMLFPGEDAEAMLRPEKVRELLTGHVPDPTALNIIRARVYTHHSRVAGRFVEGRVCLVGDAAHLMPPWAGQGMNTGIRDATNVAWKLAAAVSGRAHPRILSTYDIERRAHAKAMVDLSDALGRILSTTSSWIARPRDTLFRSIGVVPRVRDWLLQMRFKPMPRYTDGGVVLHRGRDAGKDTAVGRMMVQPKVETAEGRAVHLDDALGAWFALVGYGTDPLIHLDAESRAFWDRIGTRYVTVVESRSGRSQDERRVSGTDSVVAEDIDGSLRDWFAAQSRAGTASAVPPPMTPRAITPTIAPA